MYLFVQVRPTYNHILPTFNSQDLENCLSLHYQSRALGKIGLLSVLKKQNDNDVKCEYHNFIFAS